VIQRAEKGTGYFLRPIWPAWEVPFLLVSQRPSEFRTPFEFQAAASTILDMEKSKVSDPMRLFTLVVSVVFVTICVSAIASGNSDGWLIAGFFGLCLLVAIFEPWFPSPWVSDNSPYR